MVAVRETSKFMTKGNKGHMVAMLRIMRYCVGTANKGLIIKPKGSWDGSKDYKLEVTEKSDSEYTKDENRKSMNGWSTYLNKSCQFQEQDDANCCVIGDSGRVVCSNTLCLEHDVHNEALEFDEVESETANDLACLQQRDKGLVQQLDSWWQDKTH